MHLNTCAISFFRTLEIVKKVSFIAVFQHGLHGKLPIYLQ